MIPVNYPPLAIEVGIWWPEPTPFFVANFLAATATSLVLLLMLRDSPTRLMRPAFLLAGLCHVLYQWSVALLANPVEDSLIHPWRMATFIHLAVWGLMAWVGASRRLDPPRLQMSAPAFRHAEIVLPMAGVALLAAVYLRQVPATCTALYALAVDPHMTLLAREFGGKLAASALASYALGALFNVAAPVVVAIALRMAWTQALARRWILVAGWVLLGFAAVAAVLITGTKGLLVPTMLVLIVTSFLWNERLKIKIAAGGFAIGALAVGLVGFELVKEREAAAGAHYDIAACAVRVNACERSTTLVESLKLRKLSLGLPTSLVNDFSDRMACACKPGADIAACPAVRPVMMAFSLETSLTEALPESDYSPSARRRGAQGENANAGPVEKALRKVLSRALSFVESIANRAMVVPLQVASWHHMYVETEQSPGLAGIPMAGRITGNLVNMPELVYQKYGYIYSSGDRTSTSTAPTGFMVFYPAYIGWAGLLLALGLVIAYDIAAALLVRRVRPGLAALAAGLMLVIAMNLAVSDFLTVMGSHGGAAALAMLGFFILADRFLRPPQVQS